MRSGRLIRHFATIKNSFLTSGSPMYESARDSLTTCKQKLHQVTSCEATLPVGSLTATVSSWWWMLALFFFENRNRIRLDGRRLAFVLAECQIETAVGNKRRATAGMFGRLSQVDERRRPENGGRAAIVSDRHFFPLVPPLFLFLFSTRDESSSRSSIGATAIRNRHAHNYSSDGATLNAIMIPK